MDQQPPGGGEPWRSVLVPLLRGHLLDAELAALVSILVAARVPAVVAAPPGVDRGVLVDALVASLPPSARVAELAGVAEEFEWLPEAIELGWRRDRPLMTPVGRDGIPRATPSDSVLLARDLAGDGDRAISGARARITVRALALGYGMIAGITADGLEGVLRRLEEPPASTDADERSRLGLVLAVGVPAVGPRIVAAHYVRPVSRDTHGHVQRLSPAVLATWSPDGDRWDHFAWGVLPELAVRLGMPAIELEREQARRASALRTRAASS